MTKAEGAGTPGTAEKRTKPRKAAPAKPRKAAASKPEKTVPATASAAPSHAGHGWLWVALVALALASGGSIASVFLLENAARDAQTRKVEAMIKSISPAELAGRQDEQLAALDSRIAALEKRMQSLPDATAAKEAEAATGLLAEKINGLAARLSAVEKAQANAPAAGPAAGVDSKQVSDELSSLKERIAALEQAQKASVPTATLERNQALVVAVGQLREALASSKPFADELAAVSKLGDSRITGITDRLTQYADQGIATTSELRGEFPKLADAVMQASGATHGGDWIDKAMAKASEVVTVRKVGDVPGDSTEAVLARAENRLAVDDLDGAVAEMGHLKGAAAQAAQDWMTRAQARVTAEKALKDLHLQVIGQIAQSDGTAK